jgi:hypothetical protein
MDQCTNVPRPEIARNELTQKSYFTGELSALPAISMTCSRFLGLLLAAVAASACGANDTAVTSPFSTSPAVSVTAADLAFCVQDINSYRARVGGLSNYGESPTMESFAAIGAQTDGVSGQAHSHFITTLGGLAVSENEELNATFATGTTIQSAIQAADATFFAEGSTGSDYQHLVSSTLTEVGCGVYIANGHITIVEDFR